MVLLTAQDIATALEGGTYSEPLNGINPYVVEDIGRREYPSVDISNVTSQERFRDVPTAKDKQIYEVRLYYRKTGFGDADEPNVKLLEDEIFNIIDALQTTDSKITITESWKREPKNRPTPHVLSVLRVMTEEIFAEDGKGIVGDDVTITLPAPAGTIDVIDVLTDDAGILKDMDLTTDTQVYTKIRNKGLLSVVISVDVDKEDEIKTIVFAGEDISVTFTKGEVADVRTVNLTDIVASGTRKEVQKQVLSMDVIY